MYTTETIVGISRRTIVDETGRRHTSTRPVRIQSVQGDEGQASFMMRKRGTVIAAVITIGITVAFFGCVHI